jgi:single-strand DNA-binding protein
MSINKCCFSGNLTRDPELRTTANGMSILSMGLAVNDRKKNALGEWEDKPNFLDLVMFGSRAAAVEPYLSKGSKVLVECRASWSSWEKDGQKRSKIEFIVEEIEFGSSRGQGSSTPANSAYSMPETYAAPAQTAAVYDEDIPF